MGQLFCKTCCEGCDCDGIFNRRPGALISPKKGRGTKEDGGGEEEEEQDYCSSWDESTTTSFKSSPSLTNNNNNNFDPKRHNKIKNKKRSVALHAEFRDRQERGVLLAPPLVTERVMVDTDNLFIGQDLGVDTLHDGGMGSSSSRRSSEVLDASRDSESSSTEQPSPPQPQQQEELCHNADIIKPPLNRQRQQSITFDKTPEENAFLDLALSDDDNFVFDGMSDRYRQKLKDSMERVIVPKNTFLIRKGDDPDYLYLILEGEVAVYIDPEEYIDENAVEIGKHALLDISVPANTLPPNSLMQSTNKSASARGHPPMGNNETTIKREFKQSFVLQLRKSLFQSSYKENQVPTAGSSSIVGHFLSVVRQSLGGGGDESQTSILTGILEDQASTGSDEEDCGGGGGDFFISMKELRGLKHERDLGPCDVFGELALIYNCARTATCFTTTNCILYRVDGETFRSILSSSNTERVKKRCTESKAAILSLYNIGVVEELDEKTLRDIEIVLHPVTFDAEDLVMSKGAYDNMMFFVMSGKLVAHDIGVGDSRKADIELGEGGHFGELNLLTGLPSIANVTVLTPKARLMAVTKKDYTKRRESLAPLMKKLWLRNTLLTIPLIAKSKLLPHEINRLVHKLEKISFPRGNVSFAGNMKSALYIVESGKIQIAVTDGDGVVNSFDQYDHFGEKSLFDDKYFESKSVQVRAVLPTECMMLSRNAIVNVIGRINRLGKPLLPVSRKLIKNMKISDLTLHRIIGIGMFGRVWLVQHKKTSFVYALKEMDKKEIIDKKMTKGVTREKNVMSSVEHPFLSNLVSTFQDAHSIYMLMDYVQGGELFGLIYNVSTKGYLSNDAAAFYGACLSEALSHLHSRNICHRDLKPENILINAAGYVVLADFGFAKIVLDNTFTTCGSPEYMAPEILLGKGHSFSVDHWALGVLLYEMLVGQTPFIHVGATRMTLFRRICNSTFAFPNPKKHGIAVSDAAKLLIKGLLNKNCGERIGSSLTLGDEEISTNPWFQGLLTEYRDAFLTEKVSPPWLPDIDNELDASYFGSHDNGEKETLHRNEVALDKKAQRLFEGF